jgi:hypothetical protein
MHIDSELPAPAVVIPRGTDIKPSKQEIRQETKTIETPQKLEARTVIQAPQIKPVAYKGSDLNATLTSILQTLDEVSRKNYYGETMLADVLRGSKSKKIMVIVKK